MARKMEMKWAEQLVGLKVVMMVASLEERKVAWKGDLLASKRD